MSLLKYIVASIMSVFILISCRTSQRGIFGKKTPHEKYEGSLNDAGLGNTRIGQLWLSAANKSLSNPVKINIPYKEKGYFEMEEPDAAGYIFSAKRGELLRISLSTNPVSGFLLFAELWEAVINNKPNLLKAADTADKSIEYEIETDGQYIVRIQPELLQSASYTITITTGPSLAFPVNKKDNPRMISFWGASRDAGGRNHEGVDIQAKKLTPAIAAADGYINSVSENNLGGKVVFLRPKGKNYNLYYAHLDKQLVSPGQSVKTGDTIGLIGNTGNARYTPAHLHFGIYANRGAIDPFPFINTNRPPPKEIKTNTEYLTKYVRNLTTGTIIKVLAVSADLYKVRLPDNKEGFVKDPLVTDQPLQKQNLQEKTSLFTIPDSTSAIKTELKPGTTITILGSYKNYYYAVQQNEYGWIKKKNIHSYHNAISSPMASINF